MYSEISHNKRKSLFLIFTFVLFVAVIGALFSYVLNGRADYPTYVAVLVGASLYAFITYFAAGKMAVALNGATQITKAEQPRLYRTVENLVITNGMPMPKVYIMDDPAPNAFATGRDPNHAIVCATTGLLDIMDDKELEGVFAHELGHVKNYDIRVSMIAFALAAVVGILADIMLRMSFFGSRSRDDDSNSSGGQLLIVLTIVAAILAPVAASLIQLSISRRREYLADATGALTTRYPEGLASALEKIGSYGSTLKRQNTATAHLFIANPLSGRSFMNLFSTHPPLEDRIVKLREMGGKL